MTTDPTPTAPDREALGDLLAVHDSYRVNDDGWVVCLCGAVLVGDDDDGSHARHLADILIAAGYVGPEQVARHRAEAAAEERARIVWWLRAGVDGPAAVNHSPAYLDAVRDLADVIEQHPERFAQAPAEHAACPRRIEYELIRYACGIDIPVGTPDAYAEHVRRWRENR